jgi:23S rRNA maturation mini-RNase III
MSSRAHSCNKDSPFYIVYLFSQTLESLIGYLQVVFFKEAVSGDVCVRFFYISKSNSKLSYSHPKAVLNIILVH